MAEKRGQCFSYETYKEGEDVVLRVDAEECPFFPSIEDNAMCMSVVIDKLVESPGITRVVFAQKRDYEYDYEQVRMLAELGKLRNQIIKQQVLLSMSSVAGMFQGPIGERRSYEMRNIIYNKLRNDPAAAYVELRRIHREEKADFYEALQARAEQVARFTPYKDRSRQQAIDPRPLTGAPFLWEELVTRERNGQIIEIYQLA